MKTPIDKHPNFIPVLNDVIGVISKALGCRVYVTFSQNTNIDYEKLVILVMDEFAITRAKLFSRTRKDETIWARLVLMYLLKKHLNGKFKRIVELVNNDMVIDRTTMYANYNRIAGLIEVGDGITERVLRIINKL